MRKLCDPGNTLAEYGVIAALVVLVAIVGLSGVSENLSLWFSSLKEDMGSQISRSQQAQVLNVQKKQAFQVATVQKTPVAKPQNPVGITSLNPSFALVQPYDPAQTVGANGINMVDEYANRITQLADKLEGNPNVNGDFIEMLRDLAADGHNVAGDERSVLTYTQSSDGSFDFSIKDRYAATKARALDYLSAHPAQLSAEDAQLLNVASNNITQQIGDFIGNSNPTSLSGLNINQKFTDTGGSGKGATYVDKQATNICSLATQCK